MFVPLFTYSEDGKHRRDNITPKALTLFQIFYDDDRITRQDIFHYVYALLHHPAYRTRFAENLKRELPRIPFIGFRGRKGARPRSPFLPPVCRRKNAGRSQARPQPQSQRQALPRLCRRWQEPRRPARELRIRQRVPTGAPGKQRGQTGLARRGHEVEQGQSLPVLQRFPYPERHPPETYDYRLGNRSALEWVIDQYRVTRDEKGNIASDPNRLDDEQYIVRLIGQVITVSLETQKVISRLAPVGF